MEKDGILTMEVGSNRLQQAAQGALAISPLSIAVVPWGILAGSFAVDVGLNPLEGQAMSAILFAGAAQLVAMGMIKTGASLFSMLVAIFFVTSRHFLYGLAMRDRISPLNVRWRVVLGFLLTDELFAVCANQDKARFDPWYALGAGLSFYLIWNAATFAGIVAGTNIPSLNEYGLEFAIASTFIAIVIPTLKNVPMLCAALVALILSVMMSYFGIESGLVIASLGGMLTGYLLETRRVQP